MKPPPPFPLWKRVLRQPRMTFMRALEMVFALIFVTRPCQWLLARRIGHGAAPNPPLRAALAAHVFYPELWEEIVSTWRLLPAGSRLLITTPPDRAAALEALRGDDPLIEIHPAENRGRDVAPFVMLLNRGLLDRFDAVLKLHSKKSPHLSLGGLRRRMLYTALAGSRENVGRILRLFADPTVGIVGPALLFRHAPVYWMADKARVSAVCARMRPPAPLALGFFEGTMFWVRPASLAPLRAADLSQAAFESEDGQLDGTLHHAVERCFTLAAIAAGHQIRGTNGRLLRPEADIGNG